MFKFQGKDSDILLSGQTSVIQGSTLSGILFLVHILDMPYIHHKIIHKPKEYKLCTKPNTKTFIDDSLVKVNEEQDIPIEMTIRNTMDLIEDYTSANKLCLNPQKTQIMLISKDKIKKQNFKIIINNKEIKHSTNVNILGVSIEDNLMWDHHINKNLIPQLNNRVRTFKQVSRYLGNKFKTVYANSIYRSKLMYGIESWGGALKTTITKLQNIQDKMTKLTLGTKGQNMSGRQRQRFLGWLPIHLEIQSAAHRMTFKVINSKIPEEIALNDANEHQSSENC